MHCSHPNISFAFKILKRENNFPSRDAMRPGSQSQGGDDSKRKKEENMKGQKLPCEGKRMLANRLMPGMDVSQHDYGRRRDIYIYIYIYVYVF